MWWKPPEALERGIDCDRRCVAGGLTQWTRKGRCGKKTGERAVHRTPDEDEGTGFQNWPARRLDVDSTRGDCWAVGKSISFQESFRWETPVAPGRFGKKSPQVCCKIGRGKRGANGGAWTLLFRRVHDGAGVGGRSKALLRPFQGNCLRVCVAWPPAGMGVLRERGPGGWRGGMVLAGLKDGREEKRRRRPAVALAVPNRKGQGQKTF